MAEVDTTSDGVSPEAKKKAEELAYFLNEIEAARKREKDYLKEGRRILEIYAGEKDNPFAILYSNTETLLPALYSAVPRPVVQRRFKDEDRLGKLAAQAGQRSLEFMVDTNVEGYETFDEAARSAVLTALLPGRGITSVKYEHDTRDVTPPTGGEAVPVKNWETVCLDSQPWDRFLMGYAKKWSKVPWIAYELHLDKDEAKKAGLDDGALQKIEFTKGEDSPGEENEAKPAESETHIGERETALFYQIWDREGGRKVRYLCPQYKDDFCAVLDDPLGLTGFFNCPRPIQFVERVHDLLPVALYSLYEDQAQEVNNLTTRIKHLIAAIKVTGVYDTELGDDIKKIVEAEENELLPADKASSLAAEKGLQNAIWFWPVEKLIVVLKELYLAREQAKRVIYEITGISDIIRGSTVASETATAQEIKSEFGKLRLKRPQKEVQRYARDLLRMMLDVAAHKFSERTFAQMTGLPFVPTEEHQAAQKIAQLAQQAGMPPDEQTQKILAMPVWGQVLEALRDDMARAYRIDIESNSTVEPEATEDQKMIAEVMNALAQYLNGIAPLVQSGALPFEAAQAMMLAIVRRFRFGPEIEDYIKAMQPPKPPDDGKAGEAAKAAAEQQKVQAETQAKAAERDIQGKVELAKHAREQQAEANARDIELAKIASQRAIAEAQAAAEAQKEAMRLDAERRAKQMELEAERRNIEMKARTEQHTEIQKASLAGAVQIEIAKINAAQKAEAAATEGQAQATAQAETTASSEKLMTKVLETQAKLMQEIVKTPDRELTIKRGRDGKVTGGTSKALT